MSNYLSPMVSLYARTSFSSDGSKRSKSHKIIGLGRRPTGDFLCRAVDAFAPSTYFATNHAQTTPPHPTTDAPRKGALKRHIEGSKGNQRRDRMHTSLKVSVKMSVRERAGSSAFCMLRFSTSQYCAIHARGTCSTCLSSTPRRCALSPPSSASATALVDRKGTPRTPGAAASPGC